jgi:adenylyltransferase/sulfurtransferase
MVKTEQSGAMDLSEEELEYYSRQIVMAEMGYNTQLKLKNSKVCLLGVGGLGSPAAMQLAAMGVGYLRIVDRDIVELTNLHRQHIYGINDKGFPKVEAATKRFQQLNPFIKIEPLPISVNEFTVKDLIRDMDVVVDGLDSMKARYVVNRACIKYRVPYVFGAAISTTGNLSTIVPRETACLECFYGNLEDKKLPKCGVVGVHPSLVNIISSLEVSEAIRVITGKQPLLANKLLHFDLDEMEFNESQLSKVDSCPVCGENQSGSRMLITHELVKEICGRKGKEVFVITPRENMDINLVDLKKFLVKIRINIRVAGKLGLTFGIKDLKVSILKSGITILEGIRKKDKALKFFNELTDNR